MRNLIILLAVAVVVTLPTWMLLKTDHLSGKQFKATYNDSNSHAYATWKLYKIDSTEYCFEYSRPYIPKNYCVPTAELIVRNKDDGSAQNGFVGARHLFLKSADSPSGEQQIDSK